MIACLSEWPLGDLTARYYQDKTTGRVGLQIVPAALSGRAAPGAPEPLAHVCFAGDPRPGGWAQGRTMRDAPSNDRFRFQAQDSRTEGGETVVTTTLADGTGVTLEHALRWRDGEPWATVETRCVNGSPKAVALEMLTSFALGGLPPFPDADAPGRVRIHRFRSAWCAEGRLDTQTVEQLHLERSPTGVAALSERFGQVGTMPVRGWFPWVGLEDAGEGVCWGAYLAWAGSWQMEIGRKGDGLGLSGGLADAEFGHWTRTLAPGEALAAPPAVVTCVRGGLDDLCDRLTAAQRRTAVPAPPVEAGLPPIFNEWCTTWGRPTRTRLESLAARLHGSGVRYLVIDAGWYRGPHGDWLPNEDAFPGGLADAARMIRDHGLIPGLWFEPNNCAVGSEGYGLTDRLLRRGGAPITVGERRFWDLTDPFVTDRLAARMTDLLAECGFGYLKIDDNETVGIGCDGAESPGEGLRRQTLGLYALIDSIRARLPDLVIENCASGGHRLEPSLTGRTAMSSFSDAHEGPEIPLIAAGLHRLLPPARSQVWAVLRAGDAPRRLVSRLASGFLGRLCLSGDIDRLDAASWGVVESALALYREAAPVIADGVSRRAGTFGDAWRRPTGWQAVTRVSADGASCLVVAHAFADAPDRFRAPLPPGRWALAGELTSAPGPVALSGGAAEAAFDGDDSARVLLLTRAEPLRPGTP